MRDVSPLTSTLSGKPDRDSELCLDELKLGVRGEEDSDGEEALEASKLP